MNEWGIELLDNARVRVMFRDSENRMEFSYILDSEGAVRFHDALTQLVKQ